MGLKWSVPRPKYTPPKTCKKAATVQLFSWEKVDCPNVSSITARVTWPAETLGLQNEVISVYNLPRLTSNPCVWMANNLFAGTFTAAMEVNFHPLGPTLDVYLVNVAPTLRAFGYGWTFDDYDSRKPKLLLPSNIPWDPSTYAQGVASCLLTLNPKG
jgi:hypothetical protein